MPGDIQNATFRLGQSFASKPDLVADSGPAGGILLGSPSGAATDALYVGKLAESPYKNVWMDTRAAHAIYVMGKRRSGKSYTLGTLSEGLVANGWIRQGNSLQGVLILDTMNVYLTMPFGVEETYDSKNAAIRDLQRWKVNGEQLPMTLFRPRGTNLPATIQSQEISLRPSDLGADEWCGLFEADPFADPLGHLMTELHAKVAEDGYTDSRNGRAVAPNPVFSLHDLVAALLFDSDLQRYHRDTIESLRRRLESIRRLPVFSDDGLDVRQLVRPGHITVLLLRELDQQLRGAMVGLVVKRLMQLRGISEQHERVRDIHLAKERRLTEEGDTTGGMHEAQAAAEAAEAAAEGLSRCWLIIDEAHNYIPSRGAIASRKPLKKYVDEGRNLGLSIVVATQQPSGLDPSIQRNADMLLVHSLSHRDDIAAAEGMINTSIPTEVSLGMRYRFEGSKSFDGLVRNLPPGYALASSDRANRLLPILVRPRVTVHGGGDY